MNELLALVKQKANISDDAAQTAVNTVINFLKQRLPGPIGSQIDNLISGSAQQGQQGGLNLGDIGRDISIH